MIVDSSISLTRRQQNLDTETRTTTIIGNIHVFEKKTFFMKNVCSAAVLPKVILKEVAKNEKYWISVVLTQIRRY